MSTSAWCGAAPPAGDAVVCATPVGDAVVGDAVVGDAAAVRVASGAGTGDGRARVRVRSPAVREARERSRVKYMVLGWEPCVVPIGAMREPSSR